MARREPRAEDSVLREGLAVLSRLRRNKSRCRGVLSVRAEVERSFEVKEIPFIKVRVFDFTDYIDNPARPVEICRNGYCFVKGRPIPGDSGGIFCLAPDQWEYDLEATKAEVLKALTASDCLKRIKEVL